MNDFDIQNGTEDVVHLRNQLSVARNEISNLRHQLKTLKHTYRKDCDEIRQKLESWRCLECRNRQLESENASATTSEMLTNRVDLPLRYIGTIYTHFPEKRGTPRQPGICSNMIAKLTLNNDVFTNPEHALEGLQEFSHMWILFHFHRNESNHTPAKVAPPRLNGLRTGVFATRSPHRPCPIGLSLVKIDRIMENTIYFSGVDMIDQTPVLDIKPYIPRYDNPAISIPFNENVTDTSNLSDLNIQDTDVSSSASFNQAQINVQELRNTDVRIMDGEENGERDQTVVGASSGPRVNTGINLEDTYHESRSVSRIGEREAPDGEEEETPQQPTPTTSATMPQMSTPQRQIRVPTWIDHPPVSMLTVHFKQRALFQLQQLGSEGEQKKAIITNVLQEDPRSVYLRERMENTNYVFRIADLYVSCKFDDTVHVVTVFQIFQDSVTQDE